MAQFIDELGSQLKGTTDADGNHVPPTAALLAVVGKTLNQLNVSVDLTDAEQKERIRNLFVEGLPFVKEDHGLASN
jgi:hypothetical protein